MFLSIASVPTAILFDIIPHSNSWIVVSIIKLLRLVSYKPIFHMFKYFEKVSMSLTLIVQAIFLYYAAVHFFGCLFIHITTLGEGLDPLTTWEKRIPVRVPLPQEITAY